MQPTSVTFLLLAIVLLSCGALASARWNRHHPYRREHSAVKEPRPFFRPPHGVSINASAGDPFPLLFGRGWNSGKKKERHISTNTTTF